MCVVVLGAWVTSRRARLTLVEQYHDRFRAIRKEMRVAGAAKPDIRFAPTAVVNSTVREKGVLRGLDLYVEL